MRALFLILGLGMTAPFWAAGQTNSVLSATNSKPTVETLVCVRHGEKPPGGLGQLTCRGLNRALALPKVLLTKFSAPQFVFAPNPSQKSDGSRYFYVRPLMTIEPTAIRCGLPVNTKFGAAELKGLEEELQKEPYHNATVYIAWEHSLLDSFAKDVVKTYGGDATKVPKWASDDFDTIFVFKITRENGRETINFTIDHEGLNGLSDDCP